MPLFLNYQKTGQSLFQGLLPRQREVLSRRFGLTTGRAETLEAIGQDLGLTRERVRQIAESALNKVKKSFIPPEVTKAFAVLRDYLQQRGGVCREETLLLEPLFDHQENSRSWISFLLSFEGSFVRSAESKENHSFWAVDSRLAERVNRTLKLAEKVLLKEKKVSELAELSSRLGEKTNASFLKSVLEVSKEILSNGEGKYGLRTWPEVNPRGVRDLALLVFRKVRKPLHFVEVARLIDEFLQGGKTAEFSVISAGAGQKRTNHQTVHNELIKDPQFILVGRGQYALREWGYEPGTVKDVITKVLKDSKKSLPADDLVKKVLSQRLVKESTILLNLGDKQCFLKTEDGRYSLREA